MKTIFALLVVGSLLAVGSQADEQPLPSGARDLPSQFLVDKSLGKDICEICECCSTTLDRSLLKSLGIKSGDGIIIKEPSAKMLHELQKSWDGRKLGPLILDSAAVGLRDFCTKCGCCGQGSDGKVKIDLYQLDPKVFRSKYYIYGK